MRRLHAIVVALPWIALASAQDEGYVHDHHAHKTSVASEAPIIITINPEVRVSVTQAGDLPPPVTCGEVMELPVKIVNQGFLTAPLQATLVDSVPEGVSLEFAEVPLKGTREEHRVLKVTLQKLGLVDITVAFRAKNDISDLGGRDRIHLLVRCQDLAARFPKNAEEFDRLFEQVKNWGRWGTDDQLGAANLITEEKRRQAIALARTGRVVSLAHPFLTEATGENGSPFEHTMNEGFTTDTYKVSYHSFIHTHLDGLCHIPYKGKDYNGYPTAAVNTEKGCTKLGVENLKNGVVTRGILIDIPRLRNVPYLEPGTPVFVEDLEAWEKKAGVKVSPGDAIFLRTGRWARWAKLGPWSLGRSEAGFHASVAPWLKARGIAFIGSDGGLEVLPSQVEDVGMPLHVLTITALGVAILDNHDLEAVAETAASLKRWEFLLSIAPLPVTGGTGSPVNSLAIF